MPVYLKNSQLLNYEEPPSEIASMLLHKGSSTLSTYSIEDYNEASLRRISVIARKEVAEDNSEFKAYLEDLRDVAGGGGAIAAVAGGEASSSQRIEHMKITEENEEYSESSMDNSHIFQKT